MKKPVSGKACFSSIAVAMLFFGPASADHGKVPAEEIGNLLASNTVSGKNENGSDVHVYHDQNGTMRGVARNGRFHDAGIWEVSEDGHYCRKWNKWRHGKRDCFFFLHLEDDVYEFEAIGDIYRSRVKLREGDPKKLKKN